MKAQNLLSKLTQTIWSNRLENRFTAGNQQKVLKLAGLILAISCLASTLTPLQAQCELACRQHAPIVLDAAGEATITPALVLNNYPDPDCPGTIIINVSTLQGQPVDTMVNCDFAGDTLMFVATHLGSGNSCWGSVVILDDAPPVVTCPELFVACTNSLIPDSIGYPVWTDNCTDSADIQFNFNDLFTNLPCSTQVSGQTVTGQVVRSWTVEDASGNVGNCQQTIWLLTGTIEDVDFPLDRDDFAAPALDCSQNAKDLSLTGQPTIDGYPLFTLGHCDFVVDTFDNNYNGCIGGAYITVRTWRLIDYCADTTVYHAQVIHRIDNQAPTIVAPGDITIGTSAKTCDAPVYLPTSWTASDTCSSFTVTVFWQFGQGFGPFLKVPKGSYEVVYRATDACGNIGMDTLLLTIVDDDKPTAVCKKDVNIALPSSGIITVPASLFDDGSYDNCELDHLEVSRDNQPFGLTATFTCNDIGKNIMVILKAIDKVGLSNTCMMLVQIQDKLAPMIVCPNDITVTCTTDIKNLSIMGVAVGTDNCQMKSVNYIDTKFLNQCQVGYVNRIWTAEDIYGNKGGCLQVITQRDTTPITVVWPQNFTSYICGQDISPAITGEPVITGKDCENLFVTYVDKVYKTAYPACYRIERCWEIKEWCTYNPNQNPNPGHWLAVQYIDILDNVAPILQLPADITIGANELGCYGELDIPSATVIDCNPLTQIINNSIYANSSGASINGIYPIGVHTIMFTAFDGCGNNSMGTMKVTVVDDKPPLAICNNGVSIGLNMNGVAILPISLIDNHSIDNCTPFQGLSFTLFPNTFNCDSIGPHEVTLTVIDDKGNANTCITTVIVQDNLGICPSGAKPEILGKIANANGLPVSGVEVLLNGIDLEISNDLGEYKFTDLQPGSNYTLAPELDKNPSNGISVSDIIALQKHITGNKIITSPYLLIAGDVNNSGLITISDIIEVRKLLLGLQPGFSQVPSWQFVTSGYTFKNPKKPTQEPFPQEILIENIQSSWTAVDFIAIKSGDVNGTANLNNVLTNEVRSGFAAELWLEDHLLEPGYTYKIPVTVRSPEAITGLQWQLSLQHDQARIIAFETGGCTTVNPEMVRTSETDIRMVWHNPLPDPEMGEEPVIYLMIESSTSLKLSEILHMGSLLQPEAVDLQGEPGQVQLRFRQPETVPSQLLEPSIPNPFRHETVVRFNVEKASQVTLRVFNALGQEVWKHEADYSPGKHQEMISGSVLGRSGTYLLLIETPYTRPISQTLVLMDE